MNYIIMFELLAEIIKPEYDISRKKRKIMIDGIEIYDNMIVYKNEIIAGGQQTSKERYEYELKKLRHIIEDEIKEKGEEKMIHWKIISRNKIEENVLEYSKYQSVKYENFMMILLEREVDITKYRDKIIKKMDDYLKYYMIGHYIKLIEKYKDNIVKTKIKEMIFEIMPDIEKLLYQIYSYDVNKEDEIINKLKEVDDEIINRCNKENETVLYVACIVKMEKVALYLITRMRKEIINKNNIINYAKEKNMFEVVKAIELKLKQ